jgi:hypothetical protein
VDGFIADRAGAFGRRIRRCATTSSGRRLPTSGARLIDELRMFRNPVLVGSGTPFLPLVTEDVGLELVETRTFGSRVICERYRRAHDDSG